MNKRIPCEADLRSAVPEVWANAVTQCKSGNPYCGNDGRCAMGGECFEVKELTLEQALVEIEHLRKELDFTRVELSRLSSVTIQLEQAKNKAVNEGKSTLVFALKHCLTIINRSWQK